VAPPTSHYPIDKALRVRPLYHQGRVLARGGPLLPGAVGRRQPRWNRTRSIWRSESRRRWPLGGAGDRTSWLRAEKFISRAFR